MDKKKITRRAVIGTTIGAVAASPIIIRALLSEYVVELPEGTRPMKLGGNIVTSYDGKEIEIQVPKMVIETPEDEKKFKELVMEEVKKSPQFAEVNRAKLGDAKSQGRQQILDKFAEVEKDSRQAIANSKDLDESEKGALLKKTLEDLEASKESALKQFDDAVKLPVNS